MNYFLKIFFTVLGFTLISGSVLASSAKKADPCKKKEGAEYCEYASTVLNEMLGISRLRLAREAQIGKLSLVIDKYVDTRYVSHFIVGSHLRGLSSANISHNAAGEIKIKNAAGGSGQPLTREQSSAIFEEFFRQYKLYFENSFGTLILGTLSGIDGFKINGVEKLEGIEHHLIDISATSSTDPSKNFEMKLRVVKLRGDSELKLIDGTFGDVSFLKTQRDFLEMLIDEQGPEVITNFGEAVKKSQKGKANNKK